MLFTRYGTRAADVADFLALENDEPLLGDTLSTRELAWMVEHEKVQHVGDVVFRRTSLAFTGDADADAIRMIADGLAPLLGWDAVRTDAEIDDTLSTLREAHGVEATGSAHLAR